MHTLLVGETTHSWIFIAAAFAAAAGPADLRKIIAAADYVEHAIPTLIELQSSLGWLITRGLVERMGCEFDLTAAGRALYAAASAEHTYVHDLRIRFAEDFAGMQASAELAPITPDEFKNALDLYRAG